MKIVKTINEVREIIKNWKKQGCTIGFVPTMGYLHEGHQSLIHAAGENDKVVVSIFVLQTSFAEKAAPDISEESALWFPNFLIS